MQRSFLGLESCYNGFFSSIDIHLSSEVKVFLLGDVCLSLCRATLVFSVIDRATG